MRREWLWLGLFAVLTLPATAADLFVVGDAYSFKPDGKCQDRAGSMLFEVHPEVMKRLMAHYQTDDPERVLKQLGIEGWVTMTPKLVVPEYEAKAEKRTYKGMTRLGIWEDERTYTNELGMRHRIGDEGWYEEWVSGPLDFDVGALGGKPG